MPKIKVLIAVKTYPTLSSKYEELVCTAGFREDGTWIRLYPVPFRKLDYAGQYKKYEWIEIDAVKNQSDFRKESYRPNNIDTQPLVIGSIDTSSNWLKRKEIVLKNNAYDDLQVLIDEAKDSKIATSLAVFKPTKVLNFYFKPCEREWDRDKLAQLKQGNLFEEKVGNTQIVKKLPYTFHFTFEDINGKQSSMMIEDWEVGALFWNCLKASDGNEEVACNKVKEKYFNDFAKTKDLYFFLGTSLVSHARKFTNPFMIIGTFHPKISSQLSLF